jgi:hypothetical protein
MSGCHPFLEGNSSLSEIVLELLWDVWLTEVRSPSVCGKVGEGTGKRKILGHLTFNYKGWRISRWEEIGKVNQ